MVATTGAGRRWGCPTPWSELPTRLTAEREAPPMDPAICEEFDAFVAKRIEEGGAPTDF